VRLGVLVPVKSFRRAKQRLSTIASPGERAELARALAEGVLGAAGDTPTFVVCDDTEVATWAEGCGATVLWRPGRGLNPAVTEGVAALADCEFDHVVVAHADLPLAHDLAAVAEPGTVTIVPDRHDDGTNVLALPTGVGFRFCYGPRSSHAHRALAVELGVSVRVLHDERLALDLDTPDDLAHPLLTGWARDRTGGEPAWTRLTSRTSPASRT
jgi:2-phospho-L-lactate guanylyltransferase